MTLTILILLPIVGAVLTLAGMLVAMSRGRLVVQSPDAA